MRILVVASWYRGQRNPVRGSFIREQAHALAGRGHEIHVAYLDQEARTSAFRVTSHHVEGITEHAISMPYPLHRIIGFYAPGLAARPLRALIRRLAPDIVHAHAARPGAVIATRALKGFSIPLVTTEHKGNLRAFWLLEHGRRQIETAYKSSHSVIAVSNSLKKSILKFFPDVEHKVFVVYNGIDTDFFSIMPEKIDGTRLPNRILFMGGLAQGKGLECLMKACSLLQMDYRLTVAGPNATDDQVRPIAERFGIEKRTTGVGIVRREQVAALLNEHDVLAVASHYETFGLVVAEALACGTPVVATRCGGVEEILRAPYGRFIPVEDAQAMAEELEYVLTTMETYPAGAARQHVVDNFSMERLVSQLEETYRRVLK